MSKLLKNLFRALNGITIGKKEFLTLIAIAEKRNKKLDISTIECMAEFTGAEIVVVDECVQESARCGDKKISLQKRQDEITAEIANNDATVSENEKLIDMFS